MCLGAGLTPSEPPELAPSWYPPPCGQMMEWQSPVNHEGWHWRPWGRWVLGSWWFPLCDSLFPILIGLDLWQQGWCRCQADIDRPGSTPNLATWQLSYWERVSLSLSSSSVKWGWWMCVFGTAALRRALTVTPSSVLLPGLRASHQLLVPSPSSTACPPCSGPLCCGNQCIFRSVLVLHWILFPFTFACSSQVHKHWKWLFLRLLILIQEFHGWVSRGLRMLWNCMYLCLCGKHNPAEGVRDLKKDHEWTIALFYPTVLTHSVVILLGCKQTVLTRLWYSEHPCEVGVHTFSPDWHCLVRERAWFYNSWHRLSDTLQEAYTSLVSISISLHSY